MQILNARSRTIPTFRPIYPPVSSLISAVSFAHRTVVTAFSAIDSTSSSRETARANQFARRSRREARSIVTANAGTLTKNHQSGFTLIEVLVAIAIVGILAVIAVPQYLDFTRRATFTELVQAAAPIRQSVELAVQTRGVTDIATLDSGALGIPATVAAAVAAHGSTVADGVITMTWRDDGTNLDAVTYTLTPNGVVPPIAWTVGGTCLAQNVC